jgi:hypothetical protein
MPLTLHDTTPFFPALMFYKAGSGGPGAIGVHDTKGIGR